MLRFLNVLLVALVILFAGCRAAPIYNAVDVPFASPGDRQLSLEEVRNAIIRAGANRGWTFEDVEPGHMIGSVAVRAKHFATVDVRFDTETFSITYRSSENLNYNKSRSEIHPNYNSWINNLRTDIQQEIVQAKAS